MMVAITTDEGIVLRVLGGPEDESPMTDGELLDDPEGDAASRFGWQIRDAVLEESQALRRRGCAS